MIFRLGLTGSIGSGKTTTAGLFREFGVPVHDADASVHALYRAEAAAPIEAVFPGTVVDGVVDRKRLTEALAGRKERFKLLESIVHPLVRSVEEQAIAKAERSGHRMIVLDIPLLFESGADKRCDAVFVTHIDAGEQKRRVLARPGMNEALFHAILARQIPDREKCRRAHAILDTGNGLAAARSEVAALLRALAPRLN
ncbi:MAG: dephospho-CoA kinase [Rhizobiales bacterium]|nr:dephospho-CoA kinase [Hyphomicrobiales bacterium]